MHEPYDINLQRVEKDNGNESIHNVLVIWFAKKPVEKGQVIIGSHENATVFRHIQQDVCFPDRGYSHYNIKAVSKDAFLLPISNRKQPIGHSENRVRT